jgi:transglutaminase-like putative cysteine protease
VTAPRWEVGCHLEFDVTEPASMAVLVAAARRPPLEVTDWLSVSVDGDPTRVTPTVVDGADGQRTHLLELPTGAVTIDYDATVSRAAAGVGDPPAAPGTPGSTGGLVSLADQLQDLRPSRYCPSDRLGGWAHREFDPEGVVDTDDPAQQAHLAQAVTSWVFERTDYVLGSSDGSDSAVETLLSSQGVCRDFAHLVITICRALDLPARLVAVYAPGLSPMDFHAVAEVCIGGRWFVYDATALAPRPALVRIATGRDAADTAFVTVNRGQAELTTSAVRAVIDGDLPADDPTARVEL